MRGYGAWRGHPRDGCASRQVAFVQAAFSFCNAARREKRAYRRRSCRSSALRCDGRTDHGAAPRLSRKNRRRRVASLRTRLRFLKTLSRCGPACLCRSAIWDRLKPRSVRSYPFVAASFRSGVAPFRIRTVSLRRDSALGPRHRQIAPPPPSGDRPPCARLAIPRSPLPARTNIAARRRGCCSNCSNRGRCFRPRPARMSWHNRISAFTPRVDSTSIRPPKSAMPTASIS